MKINFGYEKMWHEKKKWKIVYNWKSNLYKNYKNNCMTFNKYKNENENENENKTENENRYLNVIK